MTDIFKRMKKEAEEKKLKQKEGYSALFSKPISKEKKVTIQSWAPPGAAAKPAAQKQVQKLAEATVQKEEIKTAVQNVEKKEGNLIRYFENKKSNLGAGGTAKDTTIEIHCYAEKAGEQMRLYLASNSGKPTKMEMDKISIEDFEKRFKPCSEHNCRFD